MMERLMEDYDFPNENPDLPNFMMAKHRDTDKLYYLQSVPLLNLTSNDRKALLKRITARTQIKHPNVVNFYEPLQNDEDTVYLKIEYCKYHTLSYLIQNECTKKCRQLHEQLLCRILYQTAFALKTVECFMESLNSDTVLLDEHYNIKLYNFFNVTIQGKAQKQKEVKMSELGILIYEACSLKQFDKSKYESELQALNYSDSFKGLVSMMVKDQSEIKKHLNKILSHPTVLLESSQWKIDRCFAELKTDTLKEDYEEKLEKLRRREAALQIKEQLLNEQERKLANKEKKLQIMERTVKEKLQQAELYLKRCREGGKSISSGSSHSSSIKHLYNEEIEASYVTREDIEVRPTSTKLQVDKIVKPPSFSRTLSERRIRFKTSPLKDRNFVRKKSARQPKILEEAKVEDSKRKSLMFLPPEYENDLRRVPGDVKTMWSEETKKYAFEMLRILNSDEKENIEVKHTIL